MTFSGVINEIYNDTGGCLVIGLYREGKEMNFSLFAHTYGLVCENDKAFIIAEDVNQLDAVRTSASKRGSAGLAHSHSLAPNLYKKFEIKEKDNKVRNSADTNFDDENNVEGAKMMKNWQCPTLTSWTLKGIAPPDNLKSHILLCGSGDNKDDVAMFLYAYQSCGGSATVVILSKNNPIEGEKAWWHTIGAAKNVYFVLGDPKNAKDLIRAKSMYARSIIVLQEDDGKAGNSLKDSGTLYITILCELIFNSNKDSSYRFRDEFLPNHQNIVTLLNQPIASSFLQVCYKRFRLIHFIFINLFSLIFLSYLYV